MIQRTLWLGPLLLAVMGGFLTFTPAVRPQSQSQQPSTQQQPSQQPSRTFVGQVVKAQNGRFALLIDKQKGTGFYLDDPEKAKPSK